MEVDTRYAPPFRGKEVKLEPKWREEAGSCQSLVDASWDGLGEVARLLEKREGVAMVARTRGQGERFLQVLV